MSKATLLACSLLLSGCCTSWTRWMGGCTYCYSTWFAPCGKFEVRPNQKTAKGTPVDVAPGLVVDLAVIDAKMDAIEACLLAVPAFHLSDEQRKAWGCTGESWAPAPLKRNCLMIKVVHPMLSSCHPEWQFINALAPESLCRAKGLEPTSECPCRWRAGIVDDYKTVTPPALYLWPAVNAVTGCANFWGTAAVPSPFAKCGGS